MTVQTMTCLRVRTGRTETARAGKAHTAKTRGTTMISMRGFFRRPARSGNLSACMHRQNGKNGKVTGTSGSFLAARMVCRSAMPGPEEGLSRRVGYALDSRAMAQRQRGVRLQLGDRGGLRHIPEHGPACPAAFPGGRARELAISARPSGPVCDNPDAATEDGACLRATHRQTRTSTTKPCLRETHRQPCLRETHRQKGE